MKRGQHLLGKLLGLAIAAAAVGPAAGCYGTDAYVGYDVPPAPREETVQFRPGYICVHAHWVHHGHGWRWHGGHYEHQRPGYVYRDGHWARHGHGHVWVEGQWTPRGASISVREHRR
jgi:hypothetical protein